MPRFFFLKSNLVDVYFFVATRLFYYRFLLLHVSFVKNLLSSKSLFMTSLAASPHLYTRALVMRTLTCENCRLYTIRSFVLGEEL